MESQPKSIEQDLMYAVVKQRYGHLLDDERLEEVRKSVMGMADFVRPLREARLPNEAEPFTTFVPFRRDDDGDD